jgi:hypothetical protein
MAIRWSQIQNLQVTEQEVNKLAGLIATAAKLNVLSAYTGTTADLNAVIGLGTSVSTHLASDAATAHTFLANSVDGQSIADSTITESKLTFDVATQVELNSLQALHNSLRADYSALAMQVDALASVVIPGQGQSLAEALAAAVAHIQNPTNAHDASAISYGENASGYYFPTANLLAGQVSVAIGTARIRFFRQNDSVRLQSNIAAIFNTTISDANYDTGVLTLASVAPTNFNIADQFRIWNLSEWDVQQSATRSLRTNTDTFTGRLTLQNNTSMDSVVIDKTGSGWDIFFKNQANLKSGSSYNLDLGIGSQRFDVDNGSNVSIFGTDNLGNSHSNTHSLRDYSSSFDGSLIKSPLTAARAWTFPNKSGFVGIGDMTFWDLLRTTADTTTGTLTVNPGVLTDEYNQKVRTWINMAKGSEFIGSSFTMLSKLAADNRLTGLGSSFIGGIVYLTDEDQLFILYSTAPKSTAALAIADIPIYLPTNYMKLALITIQGNGAGGVVNSSLKIHEDLRPLLTQGMSNAHYDESIHYPSALITGTLVYLPANSRAGGRDQGYSTGTGALEVYVNDTFRERGRDYTEVAGVAPGSIVFSYDLPANSVVRLRMSWGAATSVGGGSGGGGGGSLQDAYSGGASIFTIVNSPVVVSSGAGTALKVIGNIEHLGFVSSTQGSAFTPQSSEPGSGTTSKLYTDINGDLIFKRMPSDTTINLSSQIELLEHQQGKTFQNTSGATIGAYKAVALHATLSGQIRTADVSSNTSRARVIGITTASIADNAFGKVVWSGVVPLAGTGFTHGDVIMASPATVGNIVSESSAALVGGNMAVEIGIVDGTSLIVDINRKGQV